MSTQMRVEESPFETRSRECRNVLTKYPDRIPVIVQPRKNSKQLPKIDKSKYIVPSDLTFSQFIYVVRRRLRLDSHSALFLFANKSIIPASHGMKKVYEEHKSEDGFLYLEYDFENVFG